MALKSYKHLEDAIFFSKEDPALLAKILFPVVRDTAVATTVYMTGDTELQLDATEAVTTDAPTVAVYDQYGIAITSPTVSFALKTAVTGCSVNSSTGVLTATAAVVAGSTPIIVATSGTAKAEIKVTIVAAAEE